MHTYCCDQINEKIKPSFCDLFIDAEVKVLRFSREVISMLRVFSALHSAQVILYNVVYRQTQRMVYIRLLSTTRISLFDELKFKEIYTNGYPYRSGYYHMRDI